MTNTSFSDLDKMVRTASELETTADCVKVYSLIHKIKRHKIKLLLWVLWLVGVIVLSYHYASEPGNMGYCIPLMILVGIGILAFIAMLYKAGQPTREFEAILNKLYRNTSNRNSQDHISDLDSLYTWATTNCSEWFKTEIIQMRYSTERKLFIIGPKGKMEGDIYKCSLSRFQTLLQKEISLRRKQLKGFIYAASPD